MAKDLRHFLAEIEQKLPDEIAYVDRQINPKHQLSGVLRKLQDEDRYPAVMFNKVKGSNMPVISNLFASTNRLALAFGISPDNMTQDYLAREEALIKPKLVRKAPVQENVMTGRDVDLGKLPIVTHCEKDAGPYLTSAVGVFKDPDTGVYDVGIFRMQLQAKNKLGVLYGVLRQSGADHSQE